LVALVACSARMAPITFSFTVTGTATIRPLALGVTHAVAQRGQRRRRPGGPTP
jgi:hypothetical protein